MLSNNFCVLTKISVYDFVMSYNGMASIKSTLLYKCVQFWGSFKLKLLIIFFKLLIPKLEIRISYIEGGQMSAVLSAGNVQDIVRI